MVAVVRDRGALVRHTIAALEQAEQGSRSLDCMMAHALDLSCGEFDQVLMEEMRTEGYEWDTIADLWSDRLQCFTTSLDQGISGENIVCVIRSAKKRKWAAVHRSVTGKDYLAWGATEVLARRLAALEALTEAIVAPRYGIGRTATIPRDPDAPSRREVETSDAELPDAPDNADAPEEDEWSILF